MPEVRMPALIARIVLLGVILPVNLPIYRWAWRLCFGTMEEFEVCIDYVMQFQFVALLKFDLHNQAYATFKVLLFVLICGGVTALQFVGLLLVFDALRDIWGSLRD
jgi:hypothetical protein